MDVSPSPPFVDALGEAPEDGRCANPALEDDESRASVSLPERSRSLSAPSGRRSWTIAGGDTVFAAVGLIFVSAVSVADPTWS